MKHKLWIRRAVLLLATVVLLSADAAISSEPPGVVIDHSPAETGVYIGSPSIAVLPDGGYVASHDVFGGKSVPGFKPVTRVFSSGDRGQSWRHLVDIEGAFWSSLFVHRGQLYLLGTRKGTSSIVIRRSTDGGKTWTRPRDEHSGVLFEGLYHCGPVPVVEHAGRVWRAFELRSKRVPGWGGEYLCAGVISAPVDSDLLQAENWTATNFLPYDAKWPGRAWLEGNVVVTPEGGIANVLRVQYPRGETAAMVGVSNDGNTASFDPEGGFIAFPGGSNKFTIRHDAKTNRYWSLVNKETNPLAYRNVLALASSADLRNWRVESVVLQHPDQKHHAWQYVDWQFDGDDLIAVSRTAWDNSHRAHDADYFTFHRIERFRGDEIAPSGQQAIQEPSGAKR